MPSKDRHEIGYILTGVTQTVRGNKQVEKSIREVTRAQHQLRAGLLGMASSMTGQYGSVVSLGLALRNTLASYADYTEAQARVRTVLAASTVNYRQNYELVSQLGESISRDLGYSVGEANGAMETLLQTGLGVHRSMRVMRNTMTLARVGNMELGTATQFVVDTMNMFQKEMVDSGENYQDFSRRMGQQLVVAANMASTNIEQLQYAFRYAGTEMANMGYSSRETISALAALSTLGYRGSTAGTRLRGAILGLLRASGPTQRFFAQFNVTQDELRNVVQTSSGEMRNLTDVMDQLRNLFRRLPTEADRSTATLLLFGKRAMAAGGTLAGLTSASRKTRDIFRDLSDEQQLNASWTRMQEARMRSFGMQMQQLKHGANELAIAFGEILLGGLDRAGKGFGDYFRDVVSGIRMAGNLNNMNAEQRRQWNALGTEIQEDAVNLRDFLVGLSAIIKGFGTLAKWFGKLIVAAPELTVALLGLRLVFGAQLVPSIISGVGALFTFNGSLSATSIAALATSRALGLLKFGLGLGIVHAVGMAIGPLSQHLAAMRGFGNEYAILNRRVEEQIGHWGNLPVLGPWIKQLAMIYNLISDLYQMHDERESRRQAEVRGATEGELRGRASVREAREGIAPEMAYQVESAREASEAMQRFAAIMYSRGQTSTEAIELALHRTGFAGEELRTATEQVTRYMANNGDYLNEMGTNLQSVAQRIFNLNGPIDDAARTWRRFTEGAGGINLGGTTTPTSTGGQPAGDVYVQRSGVLPFSVSRGDMLISRDHLAAALTTGRGGMVNTQRGMTGPETSAPSSPSTIEVVIPVQIDGREIARAQGRVEVQQLERGGARFRPGARRALRETGVAHRGIA